MDSQDYAAAIERAALALHTDLQADNAVYRGERTNLTDHTVDYQERVYRTATVIVDALVEYFPAVGTASVVLPEPLRASDSAAVFEAGEDLPAVRVADGVVRFGSQSYWNVAKGDSPAELAGALLAAEQYAKASI